MSDDVKPEVIKKTQESLGKFIKKPTLTEKLLKKPPFRFLHDICTSVTKETGFFEGVLSQEDQFENIKDKEGKIVFLQKVIAAVEAANGIKLGVKPNKVVAGLEATKTNEFLQALGKALEKQQEKKNSKAAAPAKTKSTKKPGKEVKEEPPDKKKSGRSSKKIVENGLNENSDNRRKTDVPTAESPKKKHSSKKTEATVPPENGDNLEEVPKVEHFGNGYPEETGEATAPRSKAIGAGESVDVPDANLIKINGLDGQGDQDRTTKEETAHGEQQREAHVEKHKHRRSSIQNGPDQAAETSEESENLSRKATVNDDNVPNNKINVINKAEFQNKTTPSSSGQLNFPKKDTSLVREGTLISRPRTSIRPTTARPASARPAAPRIRDRGDVTVAEEVMKPASGKVQVIVDEDTGNEADDEDLISLETTNDIALEESTSILENPTAEATAANHEHGHLVEQILEAQRELEDDARFSERKEPGRTEIEWETGRNKETANREVEKLRTGIQTLTRIANPLGKLLDFFQEDFEIVQKELESWKEKNASYCLQIEQEKSITEQYVEPLKIHLKEIQKNIDEQLDQISIVKANIIRNNEKINKLLSGM